MPSLVSGISYKKLVFKSNFGTTHETLYAHAWKRKCNYIKLQDLSNIQAFLCPTNLNLENVRYAVEFFCAFHAAQLAISTQTCMFCFFTQEGLQIPSLNSLLTFYPNLRKN
jgi:hypothetical protein